MVDGIDQFVPEEAAAKDYVEREVIVAQPGGKYLTEDDWVSPGYPGCDWLFFQVHGEDYTLLWHSMINDMTPGTELFEEYVGEQLAQLDSGIVGLA